MTYVNDFDQFKAAILDLNEDTIVLTGDIVGLSGGVIIPRTKTNLIIDGLDPITGIAHTFTDYNSASFDNTVRLTSASGEVHIYLRNLNIFCRNYYGVVSIVDNTVASNVNLHFENVTMEGEQLSYNRFGHTIIKDSTISIKHLLGSLSAANELAETNRITFQGLVNITHESTGSSVVYFTNPNPSFTIEESALVNINVTVRELVYSDNPVDMEFKQDCVFNLISNHGMFYSTGTHRAQNFIIRRSAQINVNQLSRNGSVPTIRLTNGMRMEEDITLRVYAKHASAAPLIYVNNNNATIDFLNPKRVIMYNATGNIFGWNNAGTLNFSTHIVNYWKNAQNGTIDDQPDYNYRKLDNSSLVISSHVLNNNTTSTSTNYVHESDGPDILDSETFDTTAAHVITLGTLPLTVNQITDSSESITGNTTVQSAIKYTNELVELTGFSDGAGNFTLELITPPAKRTTTTVISNNDYLNHRIISKVAGSIRFYEVPQQMGFMPKVVPTKKTTILRDQEGWCLSVLDTRDNGALWQVYATIEHELSCDTGEIPSAVVYKSASDQTLSSTRVLVYEGQGNIEESTITTIKWEEEKGIILQLKPDTKYKGSIYRTSINWELTST